MATTTTLLTRNPASFSSKRTNKAIHIEDVAFTRPKAAPMKPSTPAWMAAANAETALWDKACAVKGKDDYSSGDTCGYPFDPAYSKVSKQQGWRKPAIGRGAVGMGHHL